MLAAKLLRPYVENCSLLPEYVEKRASLGYASFNANAYTEPVKEVPKESNTKEIGKTF
jgi:hypothetical protein